MNSPADLRLAIKENDQLSILTWINQNPDRNRARLFCWETQIENQDNKDLKDKKDLKDQTESVLGLAVKLGHATLVSYLLKQLMLTEDYSALHKEIASALELHRQSNQENKNKDIEAELLNYQKRVALKLSTRKPQARPRPATASRSSIGYSGSSLSASLSTKSGSLSNSSSSLSLTAHKNPHLKVKTGSSRTETKIEANDREHKAELDNTSTSQTKNPFIQKLLAQLPQEKQTLVTGQTEVVRHLKILKSSVIRNLFFKAYTATTAQPLEHYRDETFTEILQLLTKMGAMGDFAYAIQAGFSNRPECFISFFESQNDSFLKLCAKNLVLSRLIAPAFQKVRSECYRMLINMLQRRIPDHFAKPLQDPDFFRILFLHWQERKTQNNVSFNKEMYRTLAAMLKQGFNTRYVGEQGQGILSMIITLSQKSSLTEMTVPTSLSHCLRNGANPLMHFMVLQNAGQPPRTQSLLDFLSHHLQHNIELATHNMSGNTVPALRALIQELLSYGAGLHNPHFRTAQSGPEKAAELMKFLLVDTQHFSDTGNRDAVPAFLLCAKNKDSGKIHLICSLQALEEVLQGKNTRVVIPNLEVIASHAFQSYPEDLAPGILALFTRYLPHCAQVQTATAMNQLYFDNWISHLDRVQTTSKFYSKRDTSGRVIGCFLRGIDTQDPNTEQALSGRHVKEKLTKLPRWTQNPDHFVLILSRLNEKDAEIDFLLFMQALQKSLGTQKLITILQKQDQAFFDHCADLLMLASAYIQDVELLLFLLNRSPDFFMVGFRNENQMKIDYLCGLLIKTENSATREPLPPSRILDILSIYRGLYRSYLKSVAEELTAKVPVTPSNIALIKAYRGELGEEDLAYQDGRFKALEADIHQTDLVRGYVDPLSSALKEYALRAERPTCMVLNPDSNGGQRTHALFFPTSIGTPLWCFEYCIEILGLLVNKGAAHEFKQFFIRLQRTLSEPAFNQLLMERLAHLLPSFGNLFLFASINADNLPLFYSLTQNPRIYPNPSLADRTQNIYFLLEYCFLRNPNSSSAAFLNTFFRAMEYYYEGMLEILQTLPGSLLPASIARIMTSYLKEDYNQAVMYVVGRLLKLPAEQQSLMNTKQLFLEYFFTQQRLLQVSVSAKSLAPGKDAKGGASETKDNKDNKDTKEDKESREAAIVGLDALVQSERANPILLSGAAQRLLMPPEDLEEDPEEVRTEHKAEVHDDAAENNDRSAGLDLPRFQKSGSS